MALVAVTLREAIAERAARDNSPRVQRLARSVQRAVAGATVRVPMVTVAEVKASAVTLARHESDAYPGRMTSGGNRPVHAGPGCDMRTVTVTADLPLQPAVVARDVASPDPYPDDYATFRTVMARQFTFLATRLLSPARDAVTAGGSPIAAMAMPREWFAQYQRWADKHARVTGRAEWREAASVMAYVMAELSAEVTVVRLDAMIADAAELECLLPPVPPVTGPQARPARQQPAPAQRVTATVAYREPPASDRNSDKRDCRTSPKRSKMVRRDRYSRQAGRFPNARW